MDIGSYENVLKWYEVKSKANAYSLTVVVDMIKSSYEDKFLGSEMLGSALGLA